VRERYLEFERSAPATARSKALLAHLDEVVDAANSLAAVVGLGTGGYAEAVTAAG
jgi:hypothetical protein